MPFLASRSLPIAIAIATALSVLAPSFPTYAREKKAASDTRRERVKGMVALNLGRYEEAAEHLEAAYSTTPDPILLFHLGQAYRLAGHYSKSLASFNAFLRTASTKPKHRSHIDRAAAEIELITSTQFIQQKSNSKEISVEDFGLTLDDPSAKDLDPAPLSEVPVDNDTKKETIAALPVAAPLVDSHSATKSPAPGLDLSPNVAVPTKSNGGKPVYGKWWFWSGVASALVMGGAATWYFSRPENGAPGTSYGSIRVSP